MTADPGLAELEQRIGVQSGFFESLLQEDDWSFVIKLHALLEAACTQLLLFHFKEPALGRVLARLELSNKTTGKVAFLDALAYRQVEPKIRCGVVGAAKRSRA